LSVLKEINLKRGVAEAPTVKTEHLNLGDSSPL
jgi:hypothetical protein